MVKQRAAAAPVFSALDDAHPGRVQALIVWALSGLPREATEGAVPRAHPSRRGYSLLWQSQDTLAWRNWPWRRLNVVPSDLATALASRVIAVRMRCWRQ